MNHENYDQRIDFVKSLLQINNLEAKSIEPVEYDMNSPFPYNNFIYYVTLSAPTTATIILKSPRSDKLQHGAVPFPANSMSFIVRLANSDPRTGMNNTNRIENEVAFITLVRQALENSGYSQIVPDIYAWASISSNQGFSIQQYMPGTTPSKGFEDLTLQDKSAVFSQMADILTLLQQFEIPQTVKNFGGLNFDEHGNIISAQMTIFKGEPCKHYTDFIRTIFKSKLQEADENPIIQGWKENGVRARLDVFIDYQLEAVLKVYGSARKSLVHADFTTNNILFDATTRKVTALLDFDFSYIATVAEEFVGFSFGNISGGNLPGPLESDSMLNLRKAMLTGFPKTLPINESSEVQWDVANAWEEGLTRAGAARPRTISHFEEIADIYWLQDKISPFELDSPIMRKWKTAEQLKTVRDKTESLIVEFLDKHSF